MSDDLVVNMGSGNWELTSYLNRAVQPVITRVIGEKQWPKWSTALYSAISRDKAYGKGKLLRAFANNPQGGIVALAKCAQLGLSPDPQLDHFALVPFGNEIQGMVMYRGWIFLAQQSGQVEWIDANVMYKQEVDINKSIRDRITNRILHEPHDLLRDEYKDSDIIGAWAMAKIRDNDRIESMILTRGEINKRRQMSKSPDSPAWTKWFPKQCCAKALQALFRTGRVPLTKSLEVLQEYDEEEIIETPATVIDEPKPVPPPSEPPPPTHLPTGAEVIYEALDEDPLPSDDKRRDTLLAAIDAEVLSQDLGDMITEITKGKALEDMTVEELDDVLGTILQGARDAEE